MAEFIKYPVGSSATYGGHSVVVCWAQKDARSVEYIPPVEGLSPVEQVNVGDLRPPKIAQQQVEAVAAKPSPYVVVETATPPVPGIAIPPREALPKARVRDAEPYCCEKCAAVLVDGQCSSCEKMAKLETENESLKKLVVDANETTREAIAKMEQMRIERAQLLQTIYTPAPAPATRKEYRIYYDVNDARLEQYVREGWTIELLQFTPAANGKHDEVADLNVVFSRIVETPASPPQPEARVSAAAVLTADYVAESQRPPVEVQPVPQAVPEAEPGALNHQPDSPERTAALYQKRSRIVGKRKAGSFIAHQNAVKKRSFAQQLADVGLPIAAQIAESGVEDAKAILNAQAYEKARAAYNRTTGGIVTIPLLTAGI